MKRQIDIVMLILKKMMLSVLFKMCINVKLTVKKSTCREKLLILK